MKALFIVNPVAGKGKSLEFIKSFEPVIRQKIDYVIEVTTEKGEATEIVRRYTAKEDYIVFAVGGDGTVNEVLNGLVGTSSQLAIIPTGSGNDFVRSIYGKYALSDLLPELLDGINEKIDILQIDEKYFLNIASVGLDADVVYNASYYKKKKFIKGDMAYLISLIKTIFGSKRTKAQIKLDGKEVCREKILLLTMANGEFYGGGIHMMPQAVVNDGIADICLVRDIKLTKILFGLPKLFKAKHGDIDEVEMYRATEVEIEAPEGCRLNIDGEISSAHKVKMHMVPKGISMRLPVRNLVPMEK